MSWGNLNAFYWLPVLLAGWILFRFYKNHLKKKVTQGIHLRILKSITQQRQPQFVHLRKVLLGLALLLFVIALARPQSGHSQQEVVSRGVEVIFAVDVSESMLSEDINPNRLGQVTQEMGRLIELLQGNKMGIVAFAGSATLLSPLTTDPAALRLYLDSLSPLSVSSQGTNFTQALAESKEAFARGGLGAENGVTRVIVIFSDGEDHEAGAEAKARELKKEGITIYTIGYGTPEGGRIPIRDQFGMLRGFKKDRSGQEIRTTFNSETLEGLAQAGGGVFYASQFGGPHLQNLQQDMAQLQQSEFNSSFVMDYEERYQIFLFLGLLLLLLERFLPEYRSTSSVWQGRYQEPQEQKEARI